jgi:hypothetical protein
LEYFSNKFNQVRQERKLGIEDSDIYIYIYILKGACLKREGREIYFSRTRNTNVTILAVEHHRDM